MGWAKTTTLLGISVYHTRASQDSSWQARAQIVDPPPSEQVIIDFIQEVTTPADCLITDYSQLLYWTNRLPPPELAEVSSNRLKSGFLTTPQLQEITNTYECPIMAPVTGRIKNTVRDYFEWSKGEYHGQLRYDDDSQMIFFGHPLDSLEHLQPYTAQLGDYETNSVIFEIVAIESLPSQVQTGGTVPIKIVWQLQQIPEEEFTVFVQLRNSDNGTVASADHQPYLGRLPFTKWPVNEPLAVVTWLDIPEDVVAGAYSLYIGLYSPVTGERLHVFNDQTGENAVRLVTFNIE
ncbi:MAG: hypothetical protein AAF485_06625 [Chloroflexota bacterium]